MKRTCKLCENYYKCKAYFEKGIVLDDEDTAEEVNAAEEVGQFMGEDEWVDMANYCSTYRYWYIDPYDVY